MDAACSKVVITDTVRIAANASEAQYEDQNNETDRSARRDTSLERKKPDGKAINEGNISAIAIREKKVFAKGSALKKSPDLMESDHEIFLGYESGAVGLLKIWLEPNGAKGLG